MERARAVSPPARRGGQGGEPPPDHPLRALCRRVETFPTPQRGRAARLGALVRSPLPDLAHRMWSPALAARVRALTSTEYYDVVQISSLEMMAYRHAVRGHGQHRPRVVFDDLNAEYQLQRRACLTDLGQPRRLHAALYSAVQWRRLRCYEARLCREADAVIAVSDTDAALLRRVAPTGRYLVLPNGVDTAAFAYRAAPPARSHSDNSEAQHEADEPIVAPARPPELLFTGTMDYRPNVDAALWFAQAILPRLLHVQPHLRCLIVGKSPAPRLHRAARACPALVVTGGVPDVRPYLARAAVYVVPMRMGSGVRLKVLEAMASGAPVVSTRMGLEGIAVTADEHALVAETPDAFAAAVLRLLAQPMLGARLAANARALVEARYDWVRLTPALPALYAALENEP